MGQQTAPNGLTPWWSGERLIDMTDQAPTAAAGWYPVDGQLRYWDGTQWTDAVAPPAPSAQVAPPPPATTSAGSNTYAIREDGKNGTVEVYADRIVRTRKKHLGKDDIQTLPIRAITGIKHDRKALRTDEVKITFGSVSYEWKVSDAERFVADVQGKMYQ